jgi:hypothetical protein
MKKLPLLLLISFLSHFALSQTPRIWTQTSVADFSSNMFNNTIVTNRSGGELRLQYPLLKTRLDTADNNYQQFLSFDVRGNYIHAWTIVDTLFAQRFDSAGIPLSSVLRVSEPGKGRLEQASNNIISSSLMDDGYFYVSWWSNDSSRVYGQLFNPLNQKVGSNLRFDLFYTSWKTNPTVFPNMSDSTFWVIMGFRTAPGVNSVLMLRWRINLQGSMMESPVRVHDAPRHLFNYTPVARMTPNGEFILTWTGKNDFTGGRGDTIYVQRFSSSGVPSTAPRIVNDLPGRGTAFTSATVDRTGKYMIVWEDNRNYNLGSAYFDVYGQLFDSDNRFVSGNFQVNLPPANPPQQPRNSNVQFRYGCFEASWILYNQPIGRYDTYYNIWSYNSRLTGTCISTTHDSGPLVQSYQTLHWSSALPSGTTIQFQLRSASSLPTLDTATWYGPTGPADFYTSSGSTIHPRHNSHRYLQYKAFFSTSLWGDSPELQDISIVYQIGNATPPSPPTNLNASTNSSLVRLTWQASPSSRLLRYNIYRGSQPGAYDSLWTKNVASTLLTYRDSTVRNRRTYYYAVSAVDSNLLESVRSNEVVASPQGITLYVQAGAPPGGNGTPQNPFARINEALSIATWGDTILALPGVYSELVRLKKGISLIGSGPRTTRIQSNTTGDTATVVWGTDSCLVRDFTIGITRNTSTSFDAIHAYPGSGLTITDNVIVNDVSPGTRTAVYARNGNVTFKRNYVVGFGTGFHNFDSTSSLIENNIFVCGVGITVNALYNSPRIINNTIVASSRGINIFNNINSNMNVRNNLLVGPDSASFSFGIYLGNGTMTAEYDNAWRFTENYFGSISGLGNISADPLFVSEARADYRLRSNSPCKDTGDPSPEFNDLDSSRNDMGAFGGPHPIDPNIFPGIPVVFGTGNATGFPGDTVSVGVSLSNASRFSRGEFSIQYVPQVARLVALSRTLLTQNFQMSVDTSFSGRISVSLLSLNEIGAGAGNIVQMRFKISPQATTGQASPLTISSVSLRDSLNQSLLIQEIRSGTIVLNPGSGSGRYIYVDQNNTGTEDGTRYHPYRRIQPAVNAARTDDTVIVASGYYQGFITMRDSIHLRGSGASITTVRGDSLWPPRYDPTVKFFRVKGCSVSGFTILTSPDILGSNIVCDSSIVSIHHNRILFAGQTSTNTMVTFVNGSQAQFADNNIYSDRLTLSPNIIVNRANVQIMRNTIGSSTADGGISLRAESRGTVGNNRIRVGQSGLSLGITLNGVRNILLHNNMILGGQSPGSAVSVRTSDSVSIVNNTIDTRYRGIDDATSTTRIINNIITGNSSFGVSAEATSTLRYNDVWGNGLNYYNTLPGYGDISLDPLFADRQRQDYHLLQGSPCRNAGDSSAIYNDLDGSRNDIGMYGGPLLDTTMFPLQGASLRLASQAVAAGDSFALPITASLIRELASASLQIMFEPAKLNFLGARTTRATSPLSLSSTIISTGTVRVSLSGTQGIGLDSTQLVELLFSARQTIGNTPITFQQAECYSPTAAIIPVQRLVNGQVNIGPTDVKGTIKMPYQFALMQNYPNPFNPATTIRYTIPNAGKVVLEVYNVLGQRITALVSAEQEAGSHIAVWNGQTERGTTVASGVYFYRLQFGGFVDTKKLLLLR